MWFKIFLSCVSSWTYTWLVVVLYTTVWEYASRLELARMELKMRSVNPQTAFATFNRGEKMDEMEEMDEIILFRVSPGFTSFMKFHQFQHFQVSSVSLISAASWSFMKFHVLSFREGNFGNIPDMKRAKKHVLPWTIWMGVLNSWTYFCVEIVASCFSRNLTCDQGGLCKSQRWYEPLSHMQCESYNLPWIFFRSSKWKGQEAWGQKETGLFFQLCNQFFPPQVFLQLLGYADLVRKGAWMHSSRWRYKGESSVGHAFFVQSRNVKTQTEMTRVPKLKFWSEVECEGLFVSEFPLDWRLWSPLQKEGRVATENSEELRVFAWFWWPSRKKSTFFVRVSLTNHKNPLFCYHF